MLVEKNSVPTVTSGAYGLYRTLVNFLNICTKLDKIRKHKFILK